MPPPRIITLTTDFGTRESFVGQMRGAALAVCPEALLVDLTHEVPPHDVAAGAFLLATAYSTFPRGTIHVAVVDPGVGTRRRAIGVRTDRFYFLAPDNGLLSRVLDEEPLESAHVLEAEHYRRETVSATFEGRDVFAPAAAWLARGVDLANFGPRAGEIVRLPSTASRIEPGRPAKVRVLMVDRFGNATLDLSRRTLAPILEALGEKARMRVATPGGLVSEFRRTYADEEGSAPILLFNSADHLEVAIRSGSAAEKLGLSPGTEVEFLIGF
jgi:S-adenosylmethionine hydrolase